MIMEEQDELGEDSLNKIDCEDDWSDIEAICNLCCIEYASCHSMKYWKNLSNWLY